MANLSPPYDPGETYNPTDDQREKAKALRNKIKNNEVTVPCDIFPEDEWKEPPSRETYIDDTTGELPEQNNIWIDSTQIRGYHIVDRLNAARAVKVLNWVIDNEYVPKMPKEVDRPKYQKINDSYYISGDGVHRSLVCKHLEIPLYAIVEDIDAW